MVWRLPNPATSTSHNGHHSDSLFSMGAEPIAAARLDKVGAIHPALAAEVALNDARVLSWASASDYDLSCGRLRCRRGQFRDDEVVQQHVQGFELHHRFVSSWGGLALASRLEVVRPSF